MKKLVLSLVALAAAFSAAAQERPKFGIGVAITPNEYQPTISVHFPITIAPQFRLEPELGILTNNQDAGGVDTSNITLGVGAFYVSRMAPALDMYVGGRLKLNFASVDDGVNDESDTDLLLAAALGGEYYLLSQFSLGLEAQLGRYQRGDVSGDDSGFFTTGLAFLRLYF